jgi:hypothetical protein
LRQDLVAKVQGATLYPALFRRYQKPHERRRPRRLAARFAKLCNLIELADTRLLVDTSEDNTGDEQGGGPCPSPPHGGVRRITQLDIVDIIGVRASDVLLGEKVRGQQWLAMVSVGCRIQFAGKREGTGDSSLRLATTRRVAPHDQAFGAFSKVARVRRQRGDLPYACQANSVRMQQPAETLAVRSPTQIGVRINGAFRSLLEGKVLASEPHTAQHIRQRDFVYRHWRLAGRRPRLLIGVGE